MTNRDYINAGNVFVLIMLIMSFVIIIVAINNIKTTYLVTVDANGIPLKVERTSDRGDCLVKLEEAYQQGPIPEQLHCVDTK